MAADETPKALYPMTCPTCAALQGRPVRVTTIKGQPGQYRVDLYCSTCSHRWSDATNAPPTSQV